MSSFFTPQQPQQPQPAKNRLPDWLTSKPAWFWLSIVAGVWVLVMLVKLVVFPSQLDKPRAEEKQRQAKQQAVDAPPTKATGDSAQPAK